MTCTRCGDEMWVCEDHPDRPWNGGEGCGELIVCTEAPETCPFVGRCLDGKPCEMAGMPCPDCNDPGPGVMPMAEPGVRLTPNLLPSAAPDVSPLPDLPFSAPRGDDPERTAP